MVAEERVTAVRARIAENKRRLLRLLAWCDPHRRPDVRAIAAKNDEVEPAFLSQPMEGDEQAALWLAEAERWLRVNVETPLNQFELENDGAGGNAVLAGKRDYRIHPRRRT